MADRDGLRRSTLTVTAGRPPAEPGAPMNPPVVFSSTYRAGGERTYGRYGGPTQGAFEDALGTLEGGRCVAFASGMAAVVAVVETLPAGARVVAPHSLYWGVRQVLDHRVAAGRLAADYLDITDTGATLAACEGAALLWLESPTNPLLDVADLPALTAGARAHGALSAVDNTFATPLLQRPLELGADIVVHSATKYLAGHSDLVAGLVVARDPEIAAQLKYIQNASGAILGPFDSWLCIRGIETLGLRIERQSRNAQAVAEWLEGHPAVARVHYPGLRSHHNHDVAVRQQTLFGGVLSLSFHDDRVETAKAFVTRTRLFKLAESLGGVKSLLCHPATMTHASVPAEKRHASGVCDSLVRLSCGIEHADDLIQDLSHSLQAVENEQLVVSN
jgi:cystathionine beta-lyase